MILKRCDELFAGKRGGKLLDPPGISEDERLVLTAGHSGSAGIAALAVAAGRSTISAATAVAALSCEALQAQVGLPYEVQSATVQLQAYLMRPSIHPYQVFLVSLSLVSLFLFNIAWLSDRCVWSARSQRHLRRQLVRGRLTRRQAVWQGS